MDNKIKIVSANDASLQILTHWRQDAIASPPLMMGTCVITEESAYLSCTLFIGGVFWVNVGCSTGAQRRRSCRDSTLMLLSSSALKPGCPVRRIQKKETPNREQVEHYIYAWLL